MLLAFASLAQAAEGELMLVQESIAENGAQWEAEETSISVLHPKERENILSGGLKEVAAGQEASGGMVNPPPQFDWRSKDGFDWTTSVKRQRCADCWAFATVAALEVLVRIRVSDPSLPVDLSEQHVVSCGHGSCSPWYLSSTCNYLRDSGTPDEVCFPYTTPPMPPCAYTCPDWEARATKIESWGWVGSIDEIKTEVLQGPVVTWMAIYTDFYYYTSGIYEYVYGDYMGGHFVVIDGWNDTGGYWICKNSWGTGWGEEGWFKIRMGVNECGIEDGSVYMRLPTLPKHNLTIYSSPTEVAFTVYGVSHTTPWSETYFEGTSVNLEMPATHGGYIWDHWSDTDPNRIKTVAIDTNTTLTAVYIEAPTLPVGGKATPINIPIGNLELLAPYIGLAILLAVSVVTVVYVKKRRRHYEIIS